MYRGCNGEGDVLHYILPHAFIRDDFVILSLPCCNFVMGQFVWD